MFHHAKTGLNVLSRPTFLTTLRDLIQENDAFALLNALVSWLRQGRSKWANERMLAVLGLLENDHELAKSLSGLLCRWLCSVRLYPLLISVGIFSRDGFGRELMDRCYERINPALKDSGDLRDVFAQLFGHERDVLWLRAVDERVWLKLFYLLSRHATVQERQLVKKHVRHEGLHAVEMLSVWVAAEALEPGLIRLDKQLLNRDSPFVALKREVALWLQAKFEHQEVDDAHLTVMLDQCRQQIAQLRKKGVVAGAGSSLGVAHLLARLDQTIERLVLLLTLFSDDDIAPRALLSLTRDLAEATAQQHSISWLLSRSIRMLSRSITQNTSSHGEHYITRNRREYWGMLFSAAGGGVVIALMSLLKIHLGEVIEHQFWLSLAEGLNYGVGFTLIFMLHFTVATKQPAMTASLFAAVVERNDADRAMNKKLAQLLADVLRSQTAAVLGNVVMAILVASLIAWAYAFWQGQPLLSDEQVQHQLNSIHPFYGALWYAAIAGVWLFCSGIISGFFDNRCDYLNMRARLYHHPWLKRLLPERIRWKFAEYIHQNYGAIAGNMSFGMLLAMTAFIGKTTALPFDIRHIAFSSANLGYLGVSSHADVIVWCQSLLFIALIGLVNLLVSFWITLWVALKARAVHIGMENWWDIFRCFGDIIRQRPLSLILPLQLSDSPNPVKQK